MIDLIIKRLVRNFVDKISLSTDRLRIIFIRDGSLIGKEWYVLNQLSRCLQDKDEGDGRLEKMQIKDVVIVDNMNQGTHFAVDIDLILRHQIEQDLFVKDIQELSEYLDRNPILETDLCFMVSQVSIQHATIASSRSCSPAPSPPISLASSQEACI